MLPQSMMTTFIAKVDLHNLLHFLRLRLDPHAQYEIRVYAEAILGFVRRLFPNITARFLEWLEVEQAVKGAVEQCRKNGVGLHHLAASIREATRRLADTLEGSLDPCTVNPS